MTGGKRRSSVKKDKVDGDIRIVHTCKHPLKFTFDFLDTSLHIGDVSRYRVNTLGAGTVQKVEIPGDKRLLCL